MSFFSSSSFRNPKKNTFDLSRDWRLSFNMGDLVPIGLEEVLPGDTFRWSTEYLIRFAPMLAPVMHRMKCYITHHYVPQRLIWDDSQKFHTGGEQGTDAPVIPNMNWPPVGGTDGYVGSLGDYFGLPVQKTGDPVATNQKNITTLPFKAYQLVWNEWYRDQNSMAEIAISKASGADPNFAEMIKLRKRCWPKDYSTSALPWAQRGAPVGAPIDYVQTVPSSIVRVDGVAIAGDLLIGSDTADGKKLQYGKTAANTGGSDARIETDANVMISTLRRAERLQEFTEKLARGGARFIEYLQNIWGVRSSDARLQRSEFLGGHVTPVVISEVLSTYTNNADQIPQGNMSGHGLSVGHSNGGFSRTFEEHGYVLTLMTVMPETAYHQGVDRLWTRKSRFDFAIPDFAHLGEQEVMTDELYFDPQAAGGGWTNDVFGYQSRYAEYKYGKSGSSGDFRTNMAYWTADRIFTAKPVLNSSYLLADPSTRIFAVTAPNVQHLYAQIHHNVTAMRKLPYFGVPGL